ncbi:MAG: DUF4416 family protein [Planctomycetia bacterium]|nr:DUF4416 family protein [Planctomycetia bacterium]
MGEIHCPLPVLPISAVFTRHEEALLWAKTRMEREWGKIILQSEGVSFSQTRYYEASMGAGLMKYLFALEPVMDPARLVEMKHQSNLWEEEFAEFCRQQKSGEIPEERPLNMDPGYVDLGKLVLASTKDYAHRIYLDRGIYAEITLFYRHKKWESHPWTFPDYGSGIYDDFLNRCREILFSCRGRGKE